MKNIFTSKKIKVYFLAFITGIINALFGAGGGIIAVKLFQSEVQNQKKAQASAVTMILPLSVISGIYYYFSGHYTLNQALPFIPFGVLGAALGMILLRKIPDKLLKKLFALFMIYTGFRIIMR